MNLKVLTFCCVSVCSIVGVSCGGPQLQIEQWFKTLNDTELKSCDKRSKFTFKESNILIDNVPCKPERPGVTGLYHFYDNTFSEDLAHEDTHLKGKGHLFLMNYSETPHAPHLQVVPLTQGYYKGGPKTICIQTKDFFGVPISRASGVFMKGRLNGEASIQTLDEKRYYVNFVKGVPHGRFRLFDKEKKNLKFIGTFVDGKIDGPCWKFSKTGRFYFGVCNALNSFVGDSDVIVASSKDEDIFTCKATNNQVLTECRETKISRIETNNDCIQTIKTAAATTTTTTRKKDVEPTFQFNVLNEQRSDFEIPADLLCLGDHSTTSWSENPSPDLKSYFKELTKNVRYEIDPFWMIGSDPSEVDRKKSVKLISAIDNIEGNVYEAVLNFNGEKEAFEFEYDGSLDEDGQFHGPAVLNVATNKKMCLRGNCKYASIQEISGIFNHGVLDGPVKIIGASKYFVTHAKMKQGSLHGVLVTFGWKHVFDRIQNIEHHLRFVNRLKNISYLGRYLNGKPVGQAWLGLIGHGFLLGDVDPKNPGKITSKNAGYIYPGFELAIVGNYQENFLQSGQTTKVIRQRCENGIKIVEFSEPEKEPIFKFDPPTNESFGDSPLIRDPYEVQLIKVAPSTVNESFDGVFAIKDIPEPASLISIYGGYMYRTKEARTAREQSCDSNDSLSYENREICMKYRKMTYNSEDFIDIPQEVDSEEFFRSTIGHKVNHSFEPNAIYSAIDHPRFGVVASVISLRPIKAGEEIFTNYGYAPDVISSKYGLGWFTELQESMPTKEEL